MKGEQRFLRALAITLLIVGSISGCSSVRPGSRGCAVVVTDTRGDGISGARIASGRRTGQTGPQGTGWLAAARGETVEASVTGHLDGAGVCGAQVGGLVVIELESVQEAIMRAANALENHDWQRAAGIAQEILLTAARSGQVADERAHVVHVIALAQMGELEEALQRLDVAIEEHGVTAALAALQIRTGGSK